MSTIHYKFKASTSFESISLPGTSARLFDVKRAIVRANNLDRSTGGGMQLEFDISVKNAMTDEEYHDEHMLLPRGTRIVVQRLPAAKGQGLLARIARADAGMTSQRTVVYGNQVAADAGFYTIESSNHDDEEFVDAPLHNNAHVIAPTQTATTPAAVDASAEAIDSEEQELAALRAVTDQAGSMYRSGTSLSRSAQPSKFSSTSAGGVPPAGSGGGYKPPSQSQAFHSQNNGMNANASMRPNADPELREQERLLAQQTAGPTKRRATGIPRTFLNIPPPAAKTTEEGGEDSGATGDGTQLQLQPNDIAFRTLVNRGGGQSGSGAGGKRRDLDYALKLTLTEIPEHLQCGICHTVVKNAMLIPWDAEGRTACEVCMRDGLAKSGFRCPLTGQEGVSPDDLIVNMGLRKAADMFVKEVMDKMDEIIQEQEAEEEQERKVANEAMLNQKAEYEGTTMDKGMLVRKGMGMGASAAGGKGRNKSDDFGEDDFGGDVFDVDEEEEEEEEEDVVEDDGGATSLTTGVKSETLNDAKNGTDKMDDKSKTETTASVTAENESDSKASASASTSASTSIPKNNTETVMNNVTSKSNANSKNNATKNAPGSESNDGKNQPQLSTQTKKDDDSSSTSRRELIKNRAPPAGYSMGPAGGAGMNRDTPPHGRGGRGGGRGGRYGNYYDQGGGRGGRSFQGGRGNAYGGGRGRFQRDQHFNNQGRGYGGPPGRGYHPQDGGFNEPNGNGNGHDYNMDGGNYHGKRSYGEMEGHGPHNGSWQGGRGRGRFGQGGRGGDFNGGRHGFRGRGGGHRGRGGGHGRFGGGRGRF